MVEINSFIYVKLFIALKTDTIAEDVPDFKTDVGHYVRHVK